MAYSELVKNFNRIREYMREFYVYGLKVEMKVCPNIVGMDIGCGMYMLELTAQTLDFEKIDAACHYIPSGKNVWEGRMEKLNVYLSAHHYSLMPVDYSGVISRMSSK